MHSGGISSSRTRPSAADSAQSALSLAPCVPHHIPRESGKPSTRKAHPVCCPCPLPMPSPVNAGAEARRMRNIQPNIPIYAGKADSVEGSGCCHLHCKISSAKGSPHPRTRRTSKATFKSEHTTREVEIPHTPHIPSPLIHIALDMMLPEPTAGKPIRVHPPVPTLDALVDAAQTGTTTTMLLY